MGNVRTSAPGGPGTGPVTLASMWTPQPLEAGDVVDLCDRACEVMRTRIPLLLADDLEVDPQLGSRGATVELHLDSLGAWVTRALALSGLIAGDEVMARWPEPVRPAAAALLDVIPWDMADLVREAPGAAGRLLEALRGYEDLAQLVTPAAPSTTARPGAWRSWCEDQRAVIIASQA